jgi:arylsulfatase A-like enzyme
MKQLSRWCARLSVLALFAVAYPVAAQQKQPNILIIWGDDIGIFNISAYNLGMMGYKTPNIDRLAKEGALFTDWYGQQSCTAGRAAFITGQSPIRTGLTKVGLPGAPEWLKKEDVTLAELLKARGYATGQFGKNHLGDRNEFMPTVHGFDEFFGNFYHLNAEEEPENIDYPKAPQFKAKFGPRGVFHCIATDRDDPAVDPRFGKWGKQKCEDTGPLTKKRMETVDEEVTKGALGFMDRRQTVLRLVELFPHARLHASEAGLGWQDGAGRLSGWYGGTRRHGRRVAQEARRNGHCRQHHRHVLHRQRCGDDELAGRGYYHVPRREGHQLGRWLSRAHHHPLAWRHQAGHGHQRHRRA